MVSFGFLARDPGDAAVLVESEEVVVFGDADLSTRLAEDARRDGLKEATEDIETDVSL